MSLVKESRAICAVCGSNAALDNNGLFTRQHKRGCVGAGVLPYTLEWIAKMKSDLEKSISDSNNIDSDLSKKLCTENKEQYIDVMKKLFVKCCKENIPLCSDKSDDEIHNDSKEWHKVKELLNI